MLSSFIVYLFYRRHQIQQQAKLQTAILKQEELATKAVLFVEENVIEKIAAGGTYFAKEILKELEKFSTLKKRKSRNRFKKQRN